ncbi:hypothetical protein [Mesorhizobium sp.]|uniref:hypothetical protein n=1 Tax=Mesorhizobium sp. TaxID=1871066 RepID=UPI000FE84F0F|nr:hypothetical protein [Mesorhizobium sp.]RWB71693.1 MAG: hypothetical protein EOQ49_14310 [Mesorhizobium sp.]
MGKELSAVLIALALAGCSPAGGSFCTAAAPLRLSAKTVDALSDAEARALLAHNRKGTKLCGWRP